MGCGQSSAAVPSASTSVSAGKSGVRYEEPERLVRRSQITWKVDTQPVEYLVNSDATSLVSVKTTTDTASQNGDVIENPQFLLSEDEKSSSRSRVDKMASNFLDSNHSQDEPSNIPLQCEYDFIQSYSHFYNPYYNWTHFSDTDGETDGEDETKVEMKNESKSNQKEGVTKGAEVEDQKQRLYTRKDLEKTADLIRIGRKIYSKALLEQLLKVSPLKHLYG